VTLDKPAFNPPNWLFGPVWITLYTLMGIALYLAWKNGLNKAENRGILYIFIAQLILNTLWTILFFGLKSPLAGLIEIVILWIAILLTIIKFYGLSPLSAYLLIPYILWVSFAAVLNFFLWKLN
jgi:benzodiazapine receptor